MLFHERQNSVSNVIQEQLSELLPLLNQAKQRVLPWASGASIAGAAITIVAYLLWPTWQEAGASTPSRIPVDIAGTLFNVPTAAFRVKVQTHSGQQERVDLAFMYPDLTPPEKPRHMTMEMVEQGPVPIDRIFLSIVAHNGTLSPEQRVATIYPRYLQAIALPAQNGLLTKPFRDASPYSGEDLFYGPGPQFVARCTRDGVTEGTCLTERRDGNADITFRFPRSWLSQWRDVATSMDRLIAALQGPRG